MIRMEPASPAAPSLIWIDGVLPVTYLDPFGCGLSFSGEFSPASVPRDVRGSDTLAGEVTKKYDVLIVRNVTGSVVSFVKIPHSQNLQSNSLSQGEIATEAIHEIGNLFRVFGKED